MLLQPPVQQASSQLAAWLLNGRLGTCTASVMACICLDKSVLVHGQASPVLSDQEHSRPQQSSSAAASTTSYLFGRMGWGPASHNRIQGSWSSLGSSLGSQSIRCWHGMHGRHGWALKSQERQRVIASLGDLNQLSVFWQQWGGDPPSKEAGPSSSRQPCRLDHLNLARFLDRVQRCTPPRVLHPSYVAQGTVSNQVGPVAQLTEDQVKRLKALVEHVCLSIEHRSKMCDPTTAGSVLLSLGRLGHSNPGLVEVLLDRAAARMQEAYLRDLSRTAQGLLLLEYRQGASWWSGAWRQVAQVLPTTMFDPRLMHKLIRAGQLLGHPAPDNVLRLWQEHQPQAQLIEGNAGAAAAGSAISSTSASA